VELYLVTLLISLSYYENVPSSTITKIPFYYKYNASSENSTRASMLQPRLVDAFGVLLKGEANGYISKYFTSRKTIAEFNHIHGYIKL
jgi:hypothetical protein